MALSRLRKPVISRAPSLIRTRLLSSSSTSLARVSTRTRDILLNGDGSLLRPSSIPLLSGDYVTSLKFKMRIGIRHFSSTDSAPHTVLEMPALSPTMNQGNIAKWRKKEGDKIEVGDILCEIETDKATLEFECLEEGFLAKILVPDGSKDVPVGQPIAVMVEEEDDLQNVPATVSGQSEAAAEKPSIQETKDDGSVKETVNSSSEELPPHIVVEMPALSPTMSQGNIAKWRKKEGDKIEVGDVICEIETDKATLEFEFLEEG